MTEKRSAILHDASAARRSIPCVYCRGPIAAESFSYWSAARRLLSATCPSCDRRVTLAAATWRRWSQAAAEITLPAG